MFQSRVLDEYDRLVGEFGLRAVEASVVIHSQQLLVRRMARQVLRDYHGTADLTVVGSDVV
jgi:hypothetical protein